MELRWLRTFAAVAERSSYSRAAEALHISQPAVSQQIKSLERSVGVELIHRGSRSVGLTRAGHAFLPHCLEAVNAADAAMRAALNSGLDDHGIVRFGLAGSMANEFIAALAKRVRDNYPGIELQFRSGLKSSEVLDLLSGDRIDLGLTADHRLSPDLHVRAAIVETVGLLVSEDHPLAGAGEVRLADLADEGFVFIAEEAGLRLRDVGFDACLKAGFRPRIVQEAPDTLTAFGLVGAGVGVAFSTEKFAQSAPGTEFLTCSDVTEQLRTILVERRSDEYGALRRVLECAMGLLPQSGLRV